MIQTRHVLVLAIAITMAYSSTAQITLVDEDYEGGSASGWTTNTVTNSGHVDYTQFLGRFAGGAGTIEKDFSLGGSFTNVTVEFDLYRMDSWDNEAFRVFIDTVQVSTHTFGTGTPADATLLGGGGNEVFSGWGDLRYRYQFVLPGTVTDVKLGFNSALNSGVTDESWGIDNVLITGTPTVFGAWDGVANDTWDTTARWSGVPSFPDATTLARIGINPGNNTVTVAGARAAIGVELTSNGQLIIGDGHSLTVGSNITSATAPIIGAGSTLATTNGTLAGLATGASGGTATLVHTGSVDASHLVMAANDTFVSTGGTLTFDLSGGANTIDGTNTVQLNGGTLEMQAAGNPLGGGTLQLNGGTFSVDGAASTVGNALSHFGYHTGPNGVMDLHNNGGMMGGGNPQDGATFFGNALLTTGPGNRGLDFNDDADFTNTGAVGQNDQYSNLWVGTLTVSVANAGNWEFRNAGDDDRAGIWLDLDGSGIFESSTPGLGTNRGEQLSWEDGGTKTVNLAAGDYLIAFTHSEGGGGSRADFRFRAQATMGAQVIIKPGDAAQAGIWTSMPVAGPVDMSSSLVEVLDDSTLNVNTETTAAFGGLSYEVDSNTLTTTGAPNGMTFTGTTFAAGITSAGIAPETATNLGPINDAGVVGPLTITKTGSADLNLDSTSTSLVATTTLDVNEGRLSADYTVGNSSGSAQYRLSGGTLAVNANGLDMQTTVTVDSAPLAGLDHHGYHTGPDGVMDLDNNGGMMGGGDPTQGATYYGSALLVNGPSDRGLDFDQDSDFTATGAIGRNDQYSNLWTGTLTVSAANAGNWEFRNAGDDDRAGIWIDLDGDEVFESSTAGLGSNRGEQLSWEDTGTKTIALAQGQYLIAFTHSEGGGGSRADFRFKSPTMGGQVIVKPGDAAQAGLWSIPAASTFELTDTATSNLQNLVMKQGDLLITGGSLLTVEQASISTATSGLVGLNTATPTTLTDVSGLDGNGQTVTIAKKGSADLVLNKAGSNLGSATFLAKSGRLIGVSGGTNPFGASALQVQGGEIVLASDSATARTYDNALEVLGDATLTAGAGGQGGNNATITLGSVGNVITLTGGILTLQTQDGYSLTIPGAISGAGGLSVTSDVTVDKAISAGSLDLSAALTRSGGSAGDRAITVGDLFLRNAAGSLNIASGETLTVNTSGTVEGGATLQLEGTMAGAGTVSVDTGSTLFGTSATVSTPVTIQSGGTIAAGAGTLGDTLDSLSTGNLTINDGGIYQWQLGATGDQIDVTGNLTLDNNWKLHLVDATAPLSLGDQLLFTYTGTGSIGTANFDTTGLPVSWQTAGVEIYHDVAGKKVYLRNLVVTAVAVGDLTWDGTNSVESEWSFGSGVDSHWDGGAISDIPIFNLTATVDSGRVEVSAGNGTAHTLTVATGGNPAGEVEITSSTILEITESAHINSGGLVTITDGTLKANVNLNVSTGGTLDIAGSGAIEAIQLNNDGTSSFAAGASGTLVQLNVDAGTTTLSTASLTITDTTVTGGDLNLTTDVPMGTLEVTGGQVVAGANHAVLNTSMTLSSANYAISSGQTFGAGGTINSTKAGRLNLNGGTLTITPPGAVSMYTTGLEAWLDASTGVTVGGGNTVTNWVDRSGNGRDAVQNTGTGTLTASELNGLPAVVFNANNETLNLGGTDFFAYDTFLVFRANNGTGKFGPSWGAPFGVPDGDDNLRTWMFEPNQSRFWGNERPGAVNWNGRTISSASNFDMTSVASSQSATMDDYMVLKVTAGSQNNIGAIRPYIIGTRMDGWSDSRTRVAEILAFDHALNATNENIVGFYLASKYGIPVTYTDPNPVLDLSGTAVNGASSTILNVSASRADFAGLTLVNGILTAQGPSAGMTFNGTTIAGASVGISTAVDVSSGAINGAGLGATIVKSGTQALLVQGAGSNLTGTTIDAQAGTLIGVAAPFGTATLQISGGDVVLSSGSSNLTFDNAVTVTGDGSLTLGAGSAGVVGPLDLTLGNAGSGIALNAGTLTVETTDDYQLVVPGTITGAGNINIVGVSVQTDQGISAGAVSIADTSLATSGNITATAALTLSGGSITSNGTLTISSTAGNVSINGTPNLTISAGGHLTTFGGDSFGPLTYDFESGDLTGWSDVGTSHGPDNLFNSGNNPVSHGRMGGEQGSWYVDGYRTQANSSSDGHSGILESDTFVLGPAASISFLIGGGSSNWSGDPDAPVANLKGIGVEREVAPGDWENIHWESCGNCNTFQARNWDASAYAGETLRVRAYDTHTGGWGWTALDDLQISSRRDLTIYGALNMEAGSQLTLDDGTGPGNGSATFASITTSTGPTINGNVIVSGAVRIDSIPETLNVTGNYTQAASSTLHWEIDGASSDLVNAAGTIDGTADWNLEINPLDIGLTINGTILMTGSAPPAAPGTVTVTLTGLYASLYVLNTPTVTVLGNSLVINGVDPVPPSISQADGDWNQAATWDASGVPTVGAAVVDGETVTVANAGATASTVIISAGTLAVQQDLTVGTTVQVGDTATLSVTGTTGVVTGTEVSLTNGATLHLDSGATVTSSIDLGSGATLRSSGAQTIPNNVTYDPASIIDVASGTLTVSASVLPAGLEAWFDASTGVTVDGSNDVTNWADQSGNSRDATTFEGTGRLTAAEVNGLPSVLFGENESLLVTGSQFFSHDTFLVFRSDSGNGVFGPNGGGWGSPFGVTSGADNLRMWMFDGGEDRFWNGERPGAVNWNGYTISSANEFDMSAVAGSHGSDMADYMVLKVTAGSAQSLGTVRNYTLGTRNDGWSNLKFATAEVMAFNRALAAGEEDAVGGYLAGKYGIASNYSSTAGFVEYGNLQVQTGATLANTGSGVNVAELSGGGTLSTSATVRSQLAPGDGGTGALSVTGNLTVQTAATMAIEIVNAQSDTVGVSGNLDITGATLNVQVTGGVGVYVIATYGGSLTGTFASINIPASQIDYAYAGGTAIAITIPPRGATVIRIR